MSKVQKQTRLWIDSDITVGEKSSLISYCDVDDGYAIAACLRSIEVDVEGISTTLGNTDDINISTRVAKDFIKHYGPNSVEVYQGSDKPLAKRATDEPLPEGVIAMAKALELGNMTILGIGAATNIALLLQHYPKLHRKIDEIVLLAGRRAMDQHFITGHWQAKPFRDLNFEADPEAYQEIFEYAVDIVLVPYESCQQTWLDGDDLERMENQSKVSEYLADESEPWLRQWQIAFGANGFMPFDMVAAAYCINPTWFTKQQWQAEFKIGPSDTEHGETKPYLICSEEVRGGRDVTYCTSTSGAVKKKLMKRIRGHDMQQFVLGMSHINIIVDDVEKATEFYQRTLGFELAYDEQQQAMDYHNVTMESFALDAGIADGQVDVDVRFLRHPQAGLYLELMRYREPQGNSELPPQPKTYDLGGPRHIAMEVSNCKEVFDFLKDQEGVRMINPSDKYYPNKLDGFPITFFYWIDPYGVQWEMESGRTVGISRSI